MDRDAIQDSTIVESVQKYLRCIFICNLGSKVVATRTNSKTAHNSKRGIDRDFIGATLDLVHIKLV